MKIHVLKRRPEVKTDKAREKRILMEIVVDAYGASERAMGWYYYLDQQLQFPFLARCIAYRPISPLEIKDEVTVIGMAPESECQREIFVMIEWGKRGLGVPLSQLEGIKVDKETRQAIGDWHYWVNKGYEY
jgi:Calcium binding